MTHHKNRVPIIEGLFTWPSDDPRIIASRCKKCGAVSFPKRPFCPNPDCKKVREDVEQIELSKRGTLYSYTAQLYQPPAPFRMEPFEPYGIGMIDMPEGIRMLSILTRKENLKIGMPVEMTVGKLYEDEENEHITWMFNPVD